jgi:hypothetical protein
MVRYMRKLIILFHIVLIYCILCANAEILKFGERYVTANVIEEKPLTVQLNGVSYRIIKLADGWDINAQRISEVAEGTSVFLDNGANFSYLGIQSPGIYKIRIDALCGNGVCEGYETCILCPSDCGECCKDSDGKDVHNKGKVTIGAIEYIDSCKNDYNVVEYICDNNIVKQEAISCLESEFCDDGSCVPKSLITGNAVINDATLKPNYNLLFFIYGVVVVGALIWVCNKYIPTHKRDR